MLKKYWAMWQISANCLSNFSNIFISKKLRNDRRKHKPQPLSNWLKKVCIFICRIYHRLRYMKTLSLDICQSPTVNKFPIFAEWILHSSTNIIFPAHDTLPIQPFRSGTKRPLHRSCGSSRSSDLSMKATMLKGFPSIFTFRSASSCVHSVPATSGLRNSIP